MKANNSKVQHITNNSLQKSLIFSSLCSDYWNIGNTIQHFTQCVNWDITYLLNRRYDIARADEEFPIKIQPPSGDLLYSVPALRLFPQSKLPNETFFIHLIFKPNKTAIQHGLYLFSIRDPDNVLRLGLKIVEVSSFKKYLSLNS
ncbi:unnamed protein product [Schistosoma mattheei]|uniref:Uncharacterized protein n=1 Tax=Schistosoma mattheei TaxID=31246 RepID=A0A183NVP3_9TREM|nr:unnamed protein product [Schistosoma mattheei]